MNKIEIEIPDGKVAKWVNGVLTLVDDKLQDITERIKTLEDACKELGDEHPLVAEYKLIDGTFTITDNLLAYLKLRIICAALNEGWKPTLDGVEYRYYVWFYFYTKGEYEKLDEEKKAHCVPLRSDCNAYTGGGLVCAFADYAGSHSVTNGGMRLALKTQELAEYCGKQFADIWCDYLFG